MASKTNVQSLAVHITLLTNLCLSVAQVLVELNVNHIRETKTYNEIDQAFPFAETVCIGKDDLDQLTRETVALISHELSANTEWITSAKSVPHEQIYEVIKAVFQVSEVPAADFTNGKKQSKVFARSSKDSDSLNGLYANSSRCGKDIIKSVVHDFPNVADFKCSKGEMQCSSMLCMPIRWRCDGITDCPDGSDEAVCPHSCPADHYPCDKDRCYPAAHKCDNQAQCVDGVDEGACPAVAYCHEEYEFLCDKSRCILKVAVCNGVKDCLDETDEKVTNCFCDPIHRTPVGTAAITYHIDFLRYPDLPGMYKCPDTYYYPDPRDVYGNSVKLRIPWEAKNIITEVDRNKSCIPRSFLCQNFDDPGSARLQPGAGAVDRFSGGFDRTIECAGDHDENSEHCSLLLNRTCSTAEWRCKNRQCILRRYWCDGKAQCTDNSDENYLMCWEHKKIPKCNANQFKCGSDSLVDHGSAQCIPQEQKCDGRWDCPSGKDEENCPSAQIPEQLSYGAVGFDVRLGYGSADSVFNHWYNTPKPSSYKPAAELTVRAENYGCLLDSEYAIQHCANTKITRNSTTGPTDTVYEHCTVPAGNVFTTPSAVAELRSQHQRDVVTLLRSIKHMLWKDQKVYPRDTNVYVINLAPLRTTIGPLAELFL